MEGERRLEPRFTILVERDAESGRLVGRVEELPGCSPQAPDMPALHANVYEAIAGYLATAEPGQPMPTDFIEAWHPAAVV